jgi:hypothetical protein
MLITAARYTSTVVFRVPDDRRIAFAGEAAINNAVRAAARNDGKRRSGIGGDHNAYLVPSEPSGQAEIARPRGSYRYSLVFKALPRSVIDGVPFVASGG